MYKPLHIDLNSVRAKASMGVAILAWLGIGFLVDQFYLFLAISIAIPTAFVVAVSYFGLVSKPMFFTAFSVMICLHLVLAFMFWNQLDGINGATYALIGFAFYFFWMPVFGVLHRKFPARACRQPPPPPQADGEGQSRP